MPTIRGKTVHIGYAYYAILQQHKHPFSSQFYSCKNFYYHIFLITGQFLFNTYPW